MGRVISRAGVGFAGESFAVGRDGQVNGRFGVLLAFQ